MRFTPRPRCILIFFQLFFLLAGTRTGIVSALPHTQEQKNPAPAEPAIEVFPLPPVGETIKRHIVFNTRQVTDIELEKDEFLEVRAQQFNVWIRLAIHNAKGELLTQYASPTGNKAIQELTFIAPEPGRYRIHIEIIEPEPGQVTQDDITFLIQTRRAATPADRAFTLCWRAKAIVMQDRDTLPAIPLAQTAIQLYRQLGDKKGEAEALFQLGRAYLYAEDPGQAARICSQALVISRDLKQELPQIRILNTLGVAHTQNGEYYKAVEYLKQAIPIEIASKSEFQLADTLRNLGNVYILIGDDQAAIRSYEQAGKIFDALGANVYRDNIRAGLGGALARTGESRKAIALLETGAKNLTQETDNPDDFPVLVALYLHLGTLHLGLQHREAAFTYADKALEVSRKNSYRALEAQALHVNGLIRLEIGNPAEAAVFFRQSIELSRSIQVRTTEINATADLARAEYRLGHLEESRQLISQAIEMTEAVRGSFGDDELRTSYLASAQSRYEFFATLLMALHRQQPAMGYDTQAFLVSERAKARTLIDILRNKSISLGDDGDQALSIRRRKFQNRINEANQALASLPATPGNAENRKTIEKELDAAVTEYRDLTNQLRKSNPRYFRLTEPVALDVKDIRTQLDDDMVLLEYALGAEKSYLWVVTKTGLKSFELPDRSKTEALARRTYETLTARGRGKLKFESDKQFAARIVSTDADYAVASRELGRLLLGPVVADLKGKHVLVVGDGALHYLPFAALPLPDSGQPLVTRCEVTQLPSISTLSVLRQDTAGRQPATKTVAVLADPVFDSADPRVKGLSAGSPGKSHVPEGSPTGDVPRSLADIDGPDRDATLARLPFSRREAEAIGALVPEAKRRIGLDFAASRETVFGNDLGQYRFVHFATHGLLNSTQPDLSGIVLSMVNEKGEPQDGFLHAYEVFNLKMPVEMVVLSGCRTGLGKEIRGEGMVGLTRAFLYAGAERVLVSHWAVEDAATSTLMAHTYAGMLKRKLRPSAALRAAQLKMMASQKYAHPFYWGAFTLQGEPR